MPGYIGAVDQGTTSSRFMIFDQAGQVVSWAQKEHRQIFPQPGWVEHDPLEIWENTRQVMGQALSLAGLSGRDLLALGVTNQRETVLIWDRATGRPLHNAVVWQCIRSRKICQELEAQGMDPRVRAITGLSLATYFSGPKLKWLLDHVQGARQALTRGEALAGTMDSWIIWQLTGGPRGGTHVTDVTNASRTMLLDIQRLDWDPELLEALDIPRAGLPRVVPSSDARPWGHTPKDGPLGAPVPVCGALGDQQAALLGQACLQPGEAKNTYGTGSFLLLNTGERPVFSRHGLITTLAYQLSGSAPVYCLEGSVAMAGALVQWLRDNLGIIERSDQVEALAASAPDNGGVYCVPAFQGLFAPHWRPDARGVIVGLTRFADRRHLARAALEAIAYQTRDIVEAMNQDSGVPLTRLKVDGGMVHNELLMQMQADFLGVPVIRPQVAETTCLGAAYAAGLAVGFWPDMDSLARNWAQDAAWQPAMSAADREKGYANWQKALARSLDWATD